MALACPGGCWLLDEVHLSVLRTLAGNESARDRKKRRLPLEMLDEVRARVRVRVRAQVHVGGEPGSLCGHRPRGARSWGWLTSSSLSSRACVRVGRAAAGHMARVRVGVAGAGEGEGAVQGQAAGAGAGAGAAAGAAGEQRCGCAGPRVPVLCVCWGATHAAPAGRALVPGAAWARIHAHARTCAPRLRARTRMHARTRACRPPRHGH